MKELLKKTLLTGIGFAVLTKEKVEEAARKIAEECKLSEEEGKKFVDELLKQSEETKKNLETKVEDLVQKTLDKWNVATRKDLEEIKARLDKLEQGSNVVEMEKGD